MKMNTRLSKRTMNLVLAGVMIALGTVLNFIKFLDMPYGGSITLCSMLPIMIYAYKCGTKWGLGADSLSAYCSCFLGWMRSKGYPAGGRGLYSAGLHFGFYGSGPGRYLSWEDPKRHGCFCAGRFVSGMLRYLCSFLSGWILWGNMRMWQNFRCLRE